MIIGNRIIHRESSINLRPQKLTVREAEELQVEIFSSAGHWYDCYCIKDLLIRRKCTFSATEGVTGCSNITTQIVKRLDFTREARRKYHTPATWYHRYYLRCYLVNTTLTWRNDVILTCLCALWCRPIAGLHGLAEWCTGSRCCGQSHYLFHVLWLCQPRWSLCRQSFVLFIHIFIILAKVGCISSMRKNTELCQWSKTPQQLSGSLLKPVMANLPWKLHQNLSRTNCKVRIGKAWHLCLMASCDASRLIQDSFDSPEKGAFLYRRTLSEILWIQAAIMHVFHCMWYDLLMTEVIQKKNNNISCWLISGEV